MQPLRKVQGATHFKQVSALYGHGNLNGYIKDFSCKTDQPIGLKCYCSS